MMIIASVAGACRRGPAVAPDAAQRADLHAALESIVASKTPPAFVIRSRSGRHLWTATREFYQKRDFTPAWLHGTVPARGADALVDALQHADRDALTPARYAADDVARLRDELAHARGAKDEHPAVALDVRLTYLYLQYANDVVDGVTDVRGGRWKTHAPAFDPVASLDGALADGSIEDALRKLQDGDPEYAALRRSLARYRSIANDGAWPRLPATFHLKPGAKDALVPALAKRLAATGDYSSSGSEALAANQTYDEHLQEAVKRFQARHGLSADGVIGKAVVEELNVPAAERVKQIEWNMERRRWLPRDLGDRYILVNIPEYRLEVRDHGQVPLAMRVIVGKKDSPTPAFSAEMTYVVLAPFWNVPADIGEKETLPSAMRDPSFLQRTKMEVVDKQGHQVDPDDVDLTDTTAYRFRQRPGGSNSLGLVKFMFPNPYNVYLHDTPADALFARDTRTFSHGCVRIEEPEKLAEYVLGDRPDWAPDRIREAMHGAQQTTVPLHERIPVYITYFTARVAPDGQVMFFRDIYGRDR